LLTSGRSGLELVYRSADWRVYRVPFARPLLTGAGGAAVERLAHGELVGRVAAAGTYRLRLRYSPVWVVRGPVCVSPAHDGTTRLDATRAGRFELAVPVFGTALRRAAGRATRTCGDEVSSPRPAGI
jgi:hypothetical protein